MSENVELEVNVKDNGLEKLNVDLAEMQRQTKELAGQIQSTGKELGSATKKYAGFNKQAQEGKVPLSAYKKALADLGAAVREGELKNKAYAGVAKALTDQLGKLKEAAKAAAKDNAELDKQVGNLSKRLEQAVQQIDKYKAALERARAKADKPKGGNSLWSKEEIDSLSKINQEANDSTRKLKEVKKSADDARMSWLRAFAVFQTARYTVTNLMSSIEEGAQQLDLERILSQQFSAFPRELKKAQELTQGVVAKGALTKSYALMSSFGIPMDQFAENMELVQKMAIRTGQSADFLTDSFARGISRLSPLILDNLGIQVSLKDANMEYASSTGVLVTEMTKQERIAALLTATLAKLETNTKGVSLSADSAAASVARFEAGLEDTWMWVKEKGGDIINLLDKMFQTQKSDTNDIGSVFERALAPLSKLKEAGLLGVIPTEMERTRDAIGLVAKFLPEASEPWDQFTKSVEDANRAILYSRTIASEQGGAWQDEYSTTRAFLGRGSSQEEVETLGQWGEAIQMIRDEQALALDIVQKTLDANKENLTAGQKSALVETAMSRARDVAILKLRAMASAQKEQGIAVADTFRVSSAFYDLLALKWTENNKTNEAALANMDAQVVAMREQSETAQLILNIREGQSVAEQRVAERVKELSEVQQKIAEAETTYAAAREEGRGKEELAALQQLRMQERRIQAEQGFWTTRVKAEDEWFKGYKTASDAVLKTEILRLRTLAAQLKVLEDQQNAYANLGPVDKPGHWGKGPMQLGGSAQAEANADQLEGLLGGEGNTRRGGSGKRNKNSIKEWFTSTVGPWMEGQLAASEENRIGEDLLRSDGGLLSKLFALMGTSGSLNGKGEMEAWQEQFEEVQTLYTEHYGSLDQNTQKYVRVMMSQLDKADQGVSKHIQNLMDWKAALTGVTDGMSFMRDGMDKTMSLGGGVTQNLFGSDIINMVDGMSTSLGKMNDALGTSEEAYGLVTGAAPALRAFTKELGANLRQQAALEMLMNAAAAWAAGAAQNYPKMAMHIAAATMYGMVASKIVRLPSKSSDSTSGSGSRGSRGTTNINISIVGDIVRTEAERGVLVQRAIDAARAEGAI